MRDIVLFLYKKTAPVGKIPRGALFKEEEMIKGIFCTREIFWQKRFLS